MTILEAHEHVMKFVVPGRRGPGCFAIKMMDGREYAVEGDLWARYSPEGKLLERAMPEEVRSGQVEEITVSCDETGARYYA